MLVAQATAAAELFTGKKFPKEMNERILRSLRTELLNVVLIGMPGAGKSSVGKILGEKLGREFIDTDEWIVSAAGLLIPEIFERFGEARFREYEREAIRRTANRGGQIIATGGGAVLDVSNMRAFKRTSRIYLLDRPLSALPTQGRPLSKGENALKRLFEERQPLYQEHCDIRIDNSESIEHAVKKIMEDFYEAADY